MAEHDEIEIVHYGEHLHRPGVHSIGVHLKAARVVIEPHSAEDQGAAEDLAEVFADAHRKIGEANRCADTRQATIQHLTSRISDLKRKIRLLSGEERTPSLFSEAHVRPDRSGDGSVWLLDPAKRWGGLGFRFSGWAELAFQCPEIRPCGVGCDDDGPFVVVCCVSTWREEQLRRLALSGAEVSRG